MTKITIEKGGLQVDVDVKVFIANTSLGNEKDGYLFDKGDVFIAHSHEDYSYARPIHKEACGRGFQIGSYLQDYVRWKYFTEQEDFLAEDIYKFGCFEWIFEPILHDVVALKLELTLLQNKFDDMCEELNVREQEDDVDVSDDWPEDVPTPAMELKAYFEKYQEYYFQCGDVAIKGREILENFDVIDDELTHYTLASRLLDYESRRLPTIGEDNV